MDTPEAKGNRMMRNLLNMQEDLSSLETREGAKNSRARAMGSFWRDARRERDLDVHELAIRLGIPFSEMGMIEMGGKAETRETFWIGPVPRELGSAIEDGLYEEFCERFNIPPYEGPDNHRPENDAINEQSSNNSPYLNRRY